MSELKDCPFCGLNVNDDEGCFPAGGLCGGYYVRCGNPNCHADLWDYTREGVVAKWNRRALTRSEVPAWQPIETAPKDRLHILAWFPSCECSFTVVWMEDAWCFAGAGLVPYGRPSHWRHLPSAPDAARSQSDRSGVES